MFCCLPVVCPGLCARKRGQQKQTKNYRWYVRAKQASYRETREIGLSTPAGKKTLRARHASYIARIELKPRPQVPDGLPVSRYSAFWLKVRVRRDMIHNRRFTNTRIHTRLPFGEWDVSCGVTQAGKPQGKIINRNPAVLVA